MMFARSQKGMSMLGWMTVLALVAFFASTAFKMLPHYMDYATLKKTIEEAAQHSSDIQGVEAFYGYVGGVMDLNNIEMSPKEIMKVSADGNEFNIHLKYEKRESLFENLDLVATFDKEFRVRMQ
jgi:hypothetical protein